jgi:hypothetical protein
MITLPFTQTVPLIFKLIVSLFFLGVEQLFELGCPKKKLFMSKRGILHWEEWISGVRLFFFDK